MDEDVLRAIPDFELIRILQERGYIVRHKREASKVLSWNRVEPMPEGIDFKVEALEKIREQITQELLDIKSRPDSSGLTKGIKSAKLRLLV